jgi:hypothetical protein
MSRRLRARELRLARAFEGIVVAVLAAPPFVGLASCHTAPSGGSSSVDATAPPADAALEADAQAAMLDGAGASDAGGDADGEPDACGSIELDAASYENDPDGCVSYRLMPCGLPPTAQREICFVDLATCIGPCHSGFLYCQLATVSCDDSGNLLDAATVVECVSCNGIAGRRPRGLTPARLTRRTPVGDYFAAMAHLESASVRAFRDLGGWLDGFGAPAALGLAARRFADDERRHTRAAARLARRFGGVPPRVRIARVREPTLAELLEDDAVEGCVKETFGALVATWQSAHAADARVRRTMRRIAADETRHAALAWEVLHWGIARLSPPERHRVESTLERALVALESGNEGADGPGDPAIRWIAGYPRPDHERRLARELACVLRHEARRRGGAP